MSFPEKTKAVVLPAYNKNLIRAMLSLRFEEIDMPHPAAGQVIIRMDATTCNPSDIAFMQGTYNVVKPLPAVPGFEGTGIVAAAGSDSIALQGKRVAVFSQDEAIGCWSQYVLMDAANCIVIKEDIDIYQAATLSINPLTALGMFEIARKRGSGTIIMNAAGGQVPSFVRVMAEKEGMEVINIFRKHSSANGFDSGKEQHNLFVEDEDFEEKLYEACRGKTNICALDAVGGAHTGVLFNALPPDSLLLLYGGLSNEAVGNIDTLSLIFNNKSIRGFNLNHYVADLKKDNEFEKVTDKLQQMIIDGEIKTKINTVFPVTKIVHGLRTYIKNMSAGKVIFTFDT